MLGLNHKWLVVKTEYFVCNAKDPSLRVGVGHSDQMCEALVFGMMYTPRF